MSEYFPLPLLPLRTFRYISNLSELWAVGREIDFCHWGDRGLWPGVIDKMLLSSNCEHFHATRIGGCQNPIWPVGCLWRSWTFLGVLCDDGDWPWVGLIVRKAGLSLLISLFWDATDDSNTYHNKFDLRFPLVCLFWEKEKIWRGESCSTCHNNFFTTVIDKKKVGPSFLLNMLLLCSFSELWSRPYFSQKNTWFTQNVTWSTIFCQFQRSPMLKIEKQINPAPVIAATAGIS